MKLLIEKPNSESDIGDNCKLYVLKNGEKIDITDIGITNININFSPNNLITANIEVLCPEITVRSNKKD